MSATKPATAAARKSRARKAPLSVVQTPSATAAKVDPAHAACRSLGHAWQHNATPVGPEESPPLGFYNAVGFSSECSSCGTVRIKWIGRSGALGTMSYRYPEGYQHTGEQKMEREEWRRAWVFAVLGE